MDSGSQRKSSGEDIQVLAVGSQTGMYQNGKAQGDVSCAPGISATVSKTRITNKCLSCWSTIIWKTVFNSGAALKRNLEKWSISQSRVPRQ